MRKILSLGLVVALVIAFSVPALAASGDLVWELTADEVAEFVADKQSSAALQNSGNFTGNDDGGKLTLKGRAQDYDAVDIKVADLCQPGVDYTLVVQIKAAREADAIRLVNTSGYADLVDPVANASSATLTLALKDPSFRVRVQTGTNASSVFPDFTIVSAKLYEGQPPAASNPKTGDSFMIFVALGVLALAGCFGFVFYRKSQSNA